MKNVLILGATGTFGKALTKKLQEDTDCVLTLFSRRASQCYATILVLAIVIAIFSAIVLTSIHNKRKGKTSCSCS